LVHPREVFKVAMLANAACVVLAHNHPSGDPTPSPDDVALTDRLVRAGELLGVKVLDHLILGDEAYYSFKEKGMV
jgi:DNA repair protein RadC